MRLIRDCGCCTGNAAAAPPPRSAPPAATGAASAPPPPPPSALSQATVAAELFPPSAAKGRCVTCIASTNALRYDESDCTPRPAGSNDEPCAAWACPAPSPRPPPPPPSVPAPLLSANDPALPEALPLRMNGGSARHVFGVGGYSAVSAPASVDSLAAVVQGAKAGVTKLLHTHQSGRPLRPRVDAASRAVLAALASNPLLDPVYDTGAYLGAWDAELPPPPPPPPPMFPLPLSLPLPPRRGEEIGVVLAENDVDGILEEDVLAGWLWKVADTKRG